MLVAMPYSGFRAPEAVFGDLEGEDFALFIEYLRAVHLRILELLRQQGADVGGELARQRRRRWMFAMRRGWPGWRRMRLGQSLADALAPEGLLPVVTWRSGFHGQAMAQIRDGYYLVDGEFQTFKRLTLSPAKALPH